MRILSIFKTLLRGSLAALLLVAGLSMAATEPTMNQIYTAAQAGKLD